MRALLPSRIFAAVEAHWLRRTHYHSLWGRELPPAELRARLRLLLRSLDRALSDAGITWWLDSGTLLGAYREGRFIPWDDDVDVAILHRDHRALLDLAGAFAAPFELVQVSRLWSVDKLVPGLARVLPSRTFLRLLDRESSLYIDIFELDEAADGRLALLPLSWMHPHPTWSKRPFSVPRDIVLPTSSLMFEDQGYPVPRETERYLQAMYGADLTPDRTLDPSTGLYLKR